MRTQNIYSNRQAPSRDVAKSFSVLNHLRFVCSGGLYDEDEDKRYVSYISLKEGPVYDLSVPDSNCSSLM